MIHKVEYDNSRSRESLVGIDTDHQGTFDDPQKEDIDYLIENLVEDP